MVAKLRTSSAAIANERAAITLRMADLMEFVSGRMDDTLNFEEVVKRLRHMGRHKEAEEFEMLTARAEELKSTSSDSS